MTAAKMHTGPITSWGLDSMYAVGYEAVRAVPYHGSESHYRDDGCTIAPHCLACPLARCRFDMAPKQAEAELRGMVLRDLFGRGMTTAEAGRALGITRRSVFRLAASQHIPLPLIERTAP